MSERRIWPWVLLAVAVVAAVVAIGFLAVRESKPFAKLDPALPKFPRPDEPKVPPKIPAGPPIPKPPPPPEPKAPEPEPKTEPIVAIVSEIKAA